MKETKRRMAIALKIRKEIKKGDEGWQQFSKSSNSYLRAIALGIQELVERSY